jgi:prefoldin subunit 5
MKDPNIGQLGINSIRFDGMKVENLPLGQGNEAREGLSDFLATDQENKERDIIARFPKHKKSFLNAQINECQSNIKKIKNFKQELKEKIAEYRVLIKQCETVDAQVAKLDPEKDKREIRKIRLEFPPYNVEAMNQQIEQFNEGIERCDEVIEQDYESISQIREVLALVQQRERELRSLNRG